MNDIWVLKGFNDDGYGGPGITEDIGCWQGEPAARAALERIKALSQSRGGLSLAGKHRNFEDFWLVRLENGETLHMGERSTDSDQASSPS